MLHIRNADRIVAARAGSIGRCDNLSVTLIIGTERAACPADGVEVALCITVSRADLFLREAHHVAEMRSGENLSSTVFQLTVDLAWLVAALQQSLIDDQIRIVGGGSSACGSRRSGCRRRRVCGGHHIVWC